MAVPIREYCRSKQYSIEEKAVSLLVEFLGFDLSKVFSELDKLAVASGDKAPRITCELIEKNIGISKDFNNFELVKALSYKNYDKCMQIVKYFESNPKQNPTMVTTGTLFSFFSKLIIAHFSTDKSDRGIALATGASNSYALNDYKTALTKYSPRQTLNAIHLLRQFDLQSKGIGSFQNEFALLKELIYNIFTSR